MARACTPLFGSHINPPASLARLRQPIIGTGGKGVVLPSLVLRREQEDVTTVFGCQIVDLARCPLPVKHAQKWALISARRAGGSRKSDCVVGRFRQDSRRRKKARP